MTVVVVLGVLFLLMVGFAVGYDLRDRRRRLKNKDAWPLGERRWQGPGAGGGGYTAGGMWAGGGGGSGGGGGGS